MKTLKHISVETVRRYIEMGKRVYEFNLSGENCIKGIKEISLTDRLDDECAYFIISDLTPESHRADLMLKLHKADLTLELHKETARRIAGLLIVKDIKRSQFAKLVGVSYKGVNRWLNIKNPTPIRKKNLAKIAEIMDCDIEYLECKQDTPRIGV